MEENPFKKKAIMKSVKTNFDVTKLYFHKFKIILEDKPIVETSWKNCLFTNKFPFPLLFNM